MININVSFDSDRINGVFETVVMGKINNLTPIMRVIAEDMRKEVQLRFRKEEAPDGTKWKRSMRAIVQNGKTLEDTGILKNSFDIRFGNGYAMCGTNVLYAKTHQYGATIKAKNKPYLSFRINGRWVKRKQVTIPARPFIGFSDKQVTRYKQMIVEYIKRGGL